MLRATAPVDTGMKLTGCWVSLLGTGKAAIVHTIHPNFDTAESFIMSQPVK